MPLNHRRSVLGLLGPMTVKTDRGDGNNDEEPRRPNTASLVPPPTALRTSHSEQNMPSSRLSHEVLRQDVPDSPPIQEENARTKRFSMLRFRNYSESHLAVRAKEGAGNGIAKPEDAPPVPSIPQITGTPSIVRTAPTFDNGDQIPERKPRRMPFARTLSKVRSQDIGHSRPSEDSVRDSERKSTTLRWRRMQGRSTASGLEDLLSAANVNKTSQDAPPAYGLEEDSELALPVPRFSESSRSDGSHGSSGDQIYGATTTTHTVSTHTTFFKLPRRNKNRNSLFPLPVRLPPPDQHHLHSPNGDPATPRASTSAISDRSLRSPDARSPPPTALHRRNTETSPIRQQTLRNQFAANASLAQSAVSFAEPSMPLNRNDSQRSHASSTSSPLQPPMRLGMRDRASTTSSWGRASVDTPPALSASTRNSTSTTGRSSLGGFLNLARFRQNSEPHSPRHGSPGTRSKSNSFAMSREALVVPEREEGDTPGKYLERLEAAVSRSMIATILSKSADPFAQAVLRSYTRRFPFFGEPIDMSLRKYLLEAELPKETQQVDRVIQSFADRYHECNPGIFLSPDQAYVIAFSLMMLHTDAFNKNNKRKMQKHDYVKNTSGQHVNEDVLGCFYDNICYTPFVHYEEEVDINGERVLPFKPKKSKLKGVVTESGKKPSGPVDPYNLLVDQKLDLLRPPIKEQIMLDDPYNYLGTQSSLDMQYLQRAFTHTGTLQIISARSRPAAYEGQVNNHTPGQAEHQQGIVDLKITKVGTLWRKAAKKKKTRSPWQEWGAILTGSQLYLFKNAHWAKGLVHQFMSHQRHGAPRTPVLFKPPLHEFKPDALIKTDNAVALVDATYNRHKNAFTFVRPGGQEEVLLADNEAEMNDWLALINYAAAFRAAAVRIRGMVGVTEEDHRSRDVRRDESVESTHSVHTATGEVTVQNRGLSPALGRQVMAARRQIMIQKISEYDKEIGEMTKQLEDMLRNARHILILAPIAPKTREEVVNAARRVDHMLMWLRRDIWKTRCHKDILALDVQQDGVSASELQILSGKEQRSEANTEAPDTAKKSLPRHGSQQSVRNPQQSPTSPQPLTAQSPSQASVTSPIARPSTTNSVGDLVDDIFRTPPENALSPKPADAWRLPPLQMNVEQQIDARDKHRGSIASTLLTATTSQRQPSWSASSASSLRQPDRLGSPPAEPSSRALTPTPSASERELERIAPENFTPPTEIVAGSQRALNLDGMAPPTPETGNANNKRTSVRRSLQKSLPGSARHRRNKESESTIRSGGEVDKENPDETPGLERAKGRFILHGKQASVIQFGDDWPNERMKARREKWREELEAKGDNAQELDQAGPSREWGADGMPGSPIVQELNRAGTDTASISTGTVRSWAEEAGMLTARGSLPSIDIRHEEEEDDIIGTDGEDWDPYDLSRREPKPRSKDAPAVHDSAAVTAEGVLDLDRDGESDGEGRDSKKNRRTVIGPLLPAADLSEAFGNGNGQKPRDEGDGV